MNSKLISKLCLGTLQFGLNYGIANKRGRIPNVEVFEILEYAHDIGLNTLDTAYAYGESENVIGEFISKAGRSFNIISKFPHIDNYNPLAVKKYLLQTLKKLRQSKIHIYMLHEFNDIVLNKEDLWREFEFLKEQRLVNKIGVSLYKPEELEYLFNNNVSFDAVQVPYNIFDRRFAEYFSILKERNIEIYVRSIFLQGLFFVEMDKINRDFQSAKENIERLRHISKDYGVSIYSICLCFVLLNPLIDRVVMGVDSLKQLRQNISSLKYMNKVKNMYKLLEALKFQDEAIILPYNWKK